MKSRIEILDECATKYSRMYDGINVDTFEDYVNCYPADMVLKMVYSAMAEYNKPINNGALDIVSKCCDICNAELKHPPQYYDCDNCSEIVRAK